MKIAKLLEFFILVYPCRYNMGVSCGIRTYSGQPTFNTSIKSEGEIFYKNIIMYVIKIKPEVKLRK